MNISRETIAFHAAQRILDKIESLGYDITDPYSIMNGDLFPSDLYWQSGASRLVVWDDCFDYVIKIALNKGYEKYCQREVDVYADAVIEGLENNFAWCSCYIEPVVEDDFYSPGIYVMEYLEGNEEEVSDSTWEYGYKQYCEERGLDSSTYDYADAYNDWRYDDDYMVLDYIESTMVKDVLRAFCKFVQKWHINDIHSANALFRDDQLVICDYAGWNW